MENVKVNIETARGKVELEFEDLQQAMERMGAANLETLRRWVRGLEAATLCAREGESREMATVPKR